MAVMMLWYFLLASTAQALKQKEKAAGTGLSAKYIPEVSVRTPNEHPRPGLEFYSETVFLRTYQLPALDVDQLNSLLDVYVIALPKRISHARGELKRTRLFQFAELLNATTPENIDPWEVQTIFYLGLN